MTIEDISMAAFTLCNSFRVVAYLPQIAKAAKDRSGAEAISFGTWGLFLVAHVSAMTYAIVNQKDWTMASLFLGNVIGCGAILLIAACKRSSHRRRRAVQVPYEAFPDQTGTPNAKRRREGASRNSGERKAQ
jgi:hypothetical protein